MLFSVLSFMIGTRVGDLSSVCNRWVARSPDQEMNIPDRVSLGQIFILPDKIIVEGNYHISEFEDSNSMLPTMDYGSNGIQIIVDESIELQIGDIISFTPRGTNITVVHRIVDEGQDEKGVFYITQGDNNPLTDQGKVRQIGRASCRERV